MKVVFLDVDGVLNCMQAEERWHGFYDIEVTHYIALDDAILIVPYERAADSDTSDELEDRHIRTTWEKGLLPHHVKLAVSMLEDNQYGNRT